MFTPFLPCDLSGLNFLSLQVSKLEKNNLVLNIKNVVPILKAPPPPFEVLIHVRFILQLCC